MIELLGEAQKIQRIVTNNLDSWGLTMNKVMITGLALGLETKACQACNFDFEWLLRYPSVLVWADKIVVTKGIWDVKRRDTLRVNRRIPLRVRFRKKCTFLFDHSWDIFQGFKIAAMQMAIKRRGLLLMDRRIVLRTH